MEKTIISKNLLELKPHGRPDFKLSIYEEVFLEVGKNSYGLHWHPELEFVLVTKGKVNVKVAGESNILKTGEGIFINGNTLHTIVRENEEASIIAVLFAPEFFGSKNVFATYLNNLRTKSLIILDAEAPILKMQELYMQKEDFWEVKLLPYLGTLLNKVLVFKKDLNNYRDNDNQRINLVLEYIATNYANKITIADLKKVLGLGKTEVSRIIKEATGYSFTTYLNNYRIQKSLPLLEASSYSITEIASMCGFNSSSYYTEIFHNLAGITPRDYKNKNK